jgi:hypothetical protein
MVSPYLERPIRTLGQALEDRARVSSNSQGRAPALPVDCAADIGMDRLDLVKVLARLLLAGHGAEGADAAEGPSPLGGRRAA